MCYRGYSRRSLAGYAALAGQLAQKFALVHAVLEGFAAVDKHDWHFVVELPSQVAITIHVHFLPREPAAAGKLCKALFHHLAEMTTFPRIDDDLPGVLHAAIVPSPLLPLKEKRSAFAVRMVIPIQE